LLVDNDYLHHMLHALSVGYPFRFDMLLFEGAVNQNVVILEGTR
jgi:hypothetical protein